MKTGVKKALALALLVSLLLAALPTALAYSYYDDYPLYKVESYSPNGYCYLYDQPSDITGRNLGKHTNGEMVKVIDYYAGNGYCFVICQNGKTGYIHDYALTAAGETRQREVYRVYSTEPAGYCYLYDAPSDINGRNLGKYSNGEYIEIVDWYADNVFASVYCRSTGRYGYIRKTCMVPEDSYKPVEFWAYVNSTSPMGYCYLYSKPSDINGTNLGRHDNGEWVRIVNWNASDKFAQVECQNGKIGYIRKTCLSW